MKVKVAVSQLKTIITRCGQGTKLICTGNLAQIDTSYLTPLTSGLTYIGERFKRFTGSATINLNGVVRVDSLHLQKRIYSAGYKTHLISF